MELGAPEVLEADLKGHWPVAEEVAVAALFELVYWERWAQPVEIGQVRSWCVIMVSQDLAQPLSLEAHLQLLVTVALTERHPCFGSVPVADHYSGPPRLDVHRSQRLGQLRRIHHLPM